MRSASTTVTAIIAAAGQSASRRFRRSRPPWARRTSRPPRRRARSGSLRAPAVVGQLAEQHGHAASVGEAGVHESRAHECRHEAEPRADRDRQYPTGTRKGPRGDPYLTFEAHVSLAQDDRMSRLLPSDEAALEHAGAKPGELGGGQARARARAADEHQIAISRQLVPAPGNLVERQQDAGFEVHRLILGGQAHIHDERRGRPAVSSGELGSGDARRRSEASNVGRDDRLHIRRLWLPAGTQGRDEPVALGEFQQGVGLPLLSERGVGAPGVVVARIDRELSGQCAKRRCRVSYSASGLPF